MPQVPVDTSIAVFLCQTAGALGVDSRSLAVVPDGSGWNDFNRNFRAELHFIGFDQHHPSLSLRIVFDGARYSRIRAAELLSGQSSIALEAIDEPFVTVLADEDAYRLLVQRLGFADSIGVLRKLHDAVLANLEGDPSTVALAQGYDFAQGVLRENATWTAFRNAGRYLMPHALPEVSDSAQAFNVVAHLPGLEGDHSLAAAFGEEFPLSRRALVLVGENGVGKTRLLSEIVGALQTPAPWEDSSGSDHVTLDPGPQFSRLIVFSSAPSDTYPRSVPPWRGLDYRFHRMTGNVSGVEDDLAQSLLDCIRTEAGPEDLNPTGRREMLDAVLEPLGFKDDLFVEVTPDADAGDILPTPIRVGGQSYLPFFATRGEQRRLQLQARMVPHAPPQVLTREQEMRTLSSGEQALLRFASLAVGSARSGSLFMFDEPETHLHPNYVSLFMSVLDRLLEATKSIALIATHSAYVVREVPSRRVRVISRSVEGEVEVTAPTLQTFGASIDTISQFVFGDTHPKHRFQEVLDLWLANTPGATLDLFRSRFAPDLNAETLSYVAQYFSERTAR